MATAGRGYTPPEMGFMYQTYYAVFEGYMVTKRGYHNKYLPDGSLLPGQQKGRSLRLQGGQSAPRATQSPGLASEGGEEV